MIYKESPHNILDAKITYFTECTPLAFSENYKGSFTFNFCNGELSRGRQIKQERTRNKTNSCILCKHRKSFNFCTIMSLKEALTTSKFLFK